MRYPCLVPKKLCRTEIRLELEHEGLNEYGEPFEPICYSGKCNYQDKAKTILTPEKKMVEITGEFHHIGASAARDGHSCFLRMCMIHKVMY